VAGRELLRGAGKLPNDLDQLAVTAIGGTPTERADFSKAIETNPALAALKTAAKVQSYPSGHWAIKDFGGDGVTIQDAMGKVLARWDTWPTPLALAAEFQRLRPDPNYDRRRDPNPTRPLAAGIPSESLLVVVALVGVALYLRTRKKGWTQ